MPLPQVLLDTLTKIDADTNAVATVVRALRDQISTGLSPTDVSTLQNKLEAVAVRLEGIAADPGQPVPPGPLPTA